LYEMLRRASPEPKVNREQGEDDQHRKAISHVLEIAATKYSLGSVSPRMATLSAIVQRLFSGNLRSGSGWNIPTAPRRNRLDAPERSD
jgi:hypothetical protein